MKVRGARDIIMEKKVAEGEKEKRRAEREIINNIMIIHINC